MSRTPAKVTQADIARALRAVRQAGGGHVEVKTDGTIVIKPGAVSVDTDETPLAPIKESIL